jgi:hypothetical protein
MKYYSLDDINEMKRNGYERKTIDKARAIQELAEFHIRNITDAFSDVTLGYGVGLREARGLDDYETESALKKLRKKDERIDWSSISIEDLNCFYSALSFVDAKGMRFILPAILIAEITGQFDHGFLSHLTQKNSLYNEQFSLFSHNQRKAIRLHLEMLIQNEEHSYDRKEIEAAIEAHWSNKNV